MTNGITTQTRGSVKENTTARSSAAFDSCAWWVNTRAVRVRILDWISFDLHCIPLYFYTGYPPPPLCNIYLFTIKMERFSRGTWIPIIWRAYFHILVQFVGGSYRLYIVQWHWLHCTNSYVTLIPFSEVLHFYNTISIVQCMHRRLLQEYEKINYFTSYYWKSDTPREPIHFR